jgi:UDP-GlcNAc:undecaprenyl-phosphate/decaprenyl-phosphate GlcNAc-1-phosphate transferase
MHDLLGQTIELQRHSVDEVLAPRIYVFFAAYVVSYVFTPVMRIVAKHYGIMDMPDKSRKIHREPVAYLGGVAVFLGWLAGLAFSQFHIGALDSSTTLHLHVRISIVAGAIVVVVLGLLDDTQGLKPILKICGQVVAALLLLLEGVGAHCLDPVVSPLNQRLLLLHLPAIPEPLIVVASCMLVVFMVVACCNATNLMDGLDGLCGGVTAVIAAGFLFLAVHLATVGPIRIGTRCAWCWLWRCWGRCWDSYRLISIRPAFSWGTRAACFWGMPARR